jgi:membrane protease YdiL (CAAX protease family)
MTTDPSQPRPTEPRTTATQYGDAAPTDTAVTHRHDGMAREDVLAREKDRFGGFKFGSAFFGWLTATGTAVLLAGLVTAIGSAIGLNAGTVDDAAEAAADNPLATTIVGAIVLALVLFIAYFAGGYVAGRMARFSGLKQGIAVWLWALVIAIIVAVVTAFAGSQWDILANLDSFPRIPVTPETATITGILTALGAAAVALIGAMLGGVAGMRYHRRVDRVGFGA